MNAFEMETLEKQREHEEKLAKIESRRRMAEKTPYLFAFWDITTGILKILCYAVILGLMAQCSCDGCIW